MTQDVIYRIMVDDSKKYKEARVNMLKQQIRTWDVLDSTILNLFNQVPREQFVPTEYESLAFADIAIPLPHGQRMMSPKEEAKILQALHITREDKVLILGNDTGFLVLLVCLLGGAVYYVHNDLPVVEDINENWLVTSLPI
jgi:protein-L-isoaspartate(D-aspartate) O-methyltransferase